MAAFDKVLEFFGLKSRKEFILEEGPRPTSDEPTSRGNPVSPGAPSAAPVAGAPRPAPAAGADPAVQAELERARAERARLEQQLRDSEQEKQRLLAEQEATPNPSANFRGEGVTGKDAGGAGASPPPADDRTKRPGQIQRTVVDAPTGVLIAIAGPNIGMVRALRPGTNTIGRRTPGSDLALPLKDDDQIISREHCEIESTNDRFTIQPLETSSGDLAETRVNGSVLERKTILKDGATVEIFDNVLRFRTVEGGA